MKLNGIKMCVFSKNFEFNSQTFVFFEVFYYFFFVSHCR